MTNCTQCNKEHPALMPCRKEDFGDIIEWLCPPCLIESKYCLGCGNESKGKDYCEECIETQNESVEDMMDNSFYGGFTEE